MVCVTNQRKGHGGQSVALPPESFVHNIDKFLIFSISPLRFRVLYLMCCAVPRGRVLRLSRVCSLCRYLSGWLLLVCCLYMYTNFSAHISQAKSHIFQ